VGRMSIPKEQNWFLLSELSELNETPKPHRERRLLRPLTRVKFEIPPSYVAVRHVTSTLHLWRGNADMTCKGPCVFSHTSTVTRVTLSPHTRYQLGTFLAWRECWLVFWVQIQLPLHPECISCRE